MPVLPSQRILSTPLAGHHHSQRASSCNSLNFSFGFHLLTPPAIRFEPTLACLRTRRLCARLAPVSLRLRTLCVLNRYNSLRHTLIDTHIIRLGRELRDWRSPRAAMNERKLLRQMFLMSSHFHYKLVPPACLQSREHAMSAYWKRSEQIMQSGIEASQICKFDSQRISASALHATTPAPFLPPAPMQLHHHNQPSTLDAPLAILLHAVLLRHPRRAPRRQ